ncbi:hypothetical protein [Streptomyces sp. NPDC091259]|uniref:hypothetical protein n=1 Tax=Streptomyces sp. NPDC091259 TaxID=3365976 RepID=UPI003827A8BE
MADEGCGDAGAGGEVFCLRAGISPIWFGVHEAVVSEAVVPDPVEIAWHAWITVDELLEVVEEWLFFPGGREALRRYLEPGFGGGAGKAAAG